MGENEYRNAIERGFEQLRSVDPAAARDTFQAAAAAAPHLVDAWVGLEQCATQSGDADAVVAVVDARLAALPSETDEELGWWFERLAMWEHVDLRALTMIVGRMLDLHPSSPVTHFARARVLMRAGESTEACEALFETSRVQAAADAAWLEDELASYAEFDALDPAQISALCARVDALRDATSSPPPRSAPPG